MYDFRSRALRRQESFELDLMLFLDRLESRTTRLFANHRTLAPARHRSSLVSSDEHYVGPASSIAKNTSMPLMAATNDKAPDMINVSDGQPKANSMQDDGLGTDATKPEERWDGRKSPSSKQSVDDVSFIEDERFHIRGPNNATTAVATANKKANPGLLQEVFSCQEVPESVTVLSKEDGSLEVPETQQYFDKDIEAVPDKQSEDRLSVQGIESDDDLDSIDNDLSSVKSSNNPKVCSKAATGERNETEAKGVNESHNETLSESDEDGFEESEDATVREHKEETVKKIEDDASKSEDDEIRDVEVSESVEESKEENFSESEEDEESEDVEVSENVEENDEESFSGSEEEESDEETFSESEDVDEIVEEIVSESEDDEESEEETVSKREEEGVRKNHESVGGSKEGHLSKREKNEKTFSESEEYNIGESEETNGKESKLDEAAASALDVCVMASTNANQSLVPKETKEIVNRMSIQKYLAEHRPVAGSGSNDIERDARDSLHSSKELNSRIETGSLENCSGLVAMRKFQFEKILLIDERSLNVSASRRVERFAEIDLEEPSRTAVMTQVIEPDIGGDEKRPDPVLVKGEKANAAAVVETKISGQQYLVIICAAMAIIRMLIVVLRRLWDGNCNILPLLC